MSNIFSVLPLQIWSSSVASKMLVSFLHFALQVHGIIRVHGKDQYDGA